jgi:hypothetical protein
MHYRRSIGQGSHYWENRLECPVEFKVLEEQLIAVRDHLPQKSIIMFRQRKARALLEKAFVALRCGERKRARELFEESRNSFLFEFPASGFFLQRNLRVGYVVENIVFPALRALKYGFHA